MQTIMTTNNGHDCVLLVDDKGVVLSCWVVDPQVLAAYLRDGANPSTWETDRWPSGFDPEMEQNEAVVAELRTISAYGNEVGRNGRIEDAERRQFWGLA
jgi:sensor domain CHASE-containing protein